MTKLQVITVLTLVGVLRPTTARPQTLPQLVAEQGHDIVITSLACGFLGSPFHESVKHADVALEGTIVSQQSRMTPDQKRIVTDYEISPRQVIFQKIVTATPRPAASVPFIFSTAGGLVTIDRFSVSWENRVNGRQVHLATGDHVVIMGRYNQNDTSWRFSAWDVFPIVNGVIHHEYPENIAESEGLPASWSLVEFIATVQKIAVLR